MEKHLPQPRKGPYQTFLNVYKYFDRHIYLFLTIYNVRSFFDGSELFLYEIAWKKNRRLNFKFES